jgi:hypothetical protein
MAAKYKHYFDIRDTKGLVVSEANFNASPDMWINFYPHDTFVKLLSNTAEVLSGAKWDKSIWIEGAFGTGKSHSALTLRKLLICSDADFEAYFDKYRQQNKLDLALKNKLILARKKKLLACFRTGPSTDKGDYDLVSSIFESIERELVKKGMTVPFGALKSEAIKWLESADGEMVFKIWLDNDPKSRFGDVLTDISVQGILDRLKSGIKVEEILSRCYALAKENKVRVEAFEPSISNLKNWIKDVVEQNKIQAIVFFWDEFTGFFKSGVGGVVEAFQNIVHFSMDATTPFYFVPITHRNMDILADDRTKIRDRFLAPVRIELSENIAIELIGSALIKDKNHEQEWNERIAKSLFSDCIDARGKISKAIDIDESKLKNILPIHPYAGLVLRYLSASFSSSNQRSMFDFLTNDEKGGGFRAFVSEYGEKDEEKFLTVPYLWEFFYNKNKDHLDQAIRNILSAYNKSEGIQLNGKQKQVFKAILLLVATSRMTNDKLDILRPTVENLRTIFAGTSITGQSAENIAIALESLNLIKIKTIEGKTTYSIAHESVEEGQVDQIKARLKNDIRTSVLIEEMELDIKGLFNFPSSQRERYRIKYVHAGNLTTEVNKVINADKEKNLIHIFVCIASTSDEYRSLKNIIVERLKELGRGIEFNIVFANVGDTVFGEVDFDTYLDLRAREEAVRQANPKESGDYKRQAREVLTIWRKKIEDGNFEFSFVGGREAKVRGVTQAVSELAEYNKTLYPYSVEAIFVGLPDTVFPTSNLKTAAMLGVDGGAAKLTGGAVSGNKEVILKPIRDIFDVPKFWEVVPSSPVSKIKLAVDEFIAEKIKAKKKVSINELHDFLKEKPYGILDTSIAGLLLGFIFRDYAHEGSYHYMDDAIDEPLTTDKLIAIVHGVITQSARPSSKDKIFFLTKQSEEANAFAEASIEIFGLIDKSVYVSKVADNIRAAMPAYAFPLFVAKEVVASGDVELIKKVIDLYCGVLNSSNYADGSESEVKHANELGALFIKHKTLVGELVKAIKLEAIKKGMIAIVDKHNGGRLAALSSELGIDYMSQLAAKFERGAGNWAWTKETATEQIDKLILEFEIIKASRDFGITASDERGLLEAWKGRFDGLRISFDAVRHLMNCKELVALIQESIRQKSISQLPKLFELLGSQGEELARLLNGQAKYFRQLFAHELKDLSDAQVEELLISKMPVGKFDELKDNFSANARKAIEEFKARLASQKIKNLFSKKSKNATPREWSEANLTPILACIPPSETARAKEVFATIEHPSPTDKAVEDALLYLESATWWKVLADKGAIDSKFEEKIIGKYKGIVSIKDARDCLLATGIEPYDWSEVVGARDAIEALAVKNYSGAGAKKAAAKIDGYKDLEALKKYLKKLIEKNIEVGVSILSEGDE